MLNLTASETMPAATELVSMAGALGAFGPAAELVFKRMAGLKLSESTAQRLAESVGTDMGQRLSEGDTFGSTTPCAWHKDADGKTCAYVAIDATGGLRKRGWTPLSPGSL